MKARYVPMDSATADRFRRTGLDDGGGSFRRVTAEQPVYPCRQCLRRANPGEQLLLGSYHLELPKGAYWTPSPVFVHLEECEGFHGENEPEILFGPPLSIRAYDADHQMIYPLTDLAHGKEALALVERAFADSKTSYVNIHTAQFGCFLCRAERG
jgi:uncharacterized protein DUF1203